jgi:hypothetical protein
MDKQLTVSELIAILQNLPGDMPVEMGMNQEYQSEVTADHIRVDQFDFHNSGRPFLFIGD